MSQVTTQLMFEGHAEEAMNLYTSLIPNSSIGTVTKYGPGEPGKEGTIKHARFTLGGQHFACIDSFVQHGFTFTPSMSIHVQCDHEEMVDKLYAALSEGGKVMMPLGEYPFSKKFAWVSDRFGVSWQMGL